MNFLGEVLIRVGLLGALFAGIMGAVTGASENVRGVSCIVIMLASVLYTTIEFKAARSRR